MYQSDIPMGSGEAFGTAGLVVTSVVVVVTVVVVVVTSTVVLGSTANTDISVTTVVGSVVVNWLQSTSVFVFSVV